MGFHPEAGIVACKAGSMQVPLTTRGKCDTCTTEKDCWGSHSELHVYGLARVTGVGFGLPPLMPCCVTPQDVLLQNKHLWMLIKACVGYQSKSKYRKWQQMLQRDPNWPPVNTKDFAARSTAEVYINPSYEHRD